MIERPPAMPQGDANSCVNQTTTSETNRPQASGSSTATHELQDTLLENRPIVEATTNISTPAPLKDLNIQSPYRVPPTVDETEPTPITHANLLEHQKGLTSKQSTQSAVAQPQPATHPYTEYSSPPSSESPTTPPKKGSSPPNGRTSTKIHRQPPASYKSWNSVNKTQAPPRVQKAPPSPPTSPTDSVSTSSRTPSTTASDSKPTRIWSVRYGACDSLHPAPTPIQGTLLNWLQTNGLGDFPNATTIDRPAWLPFLKALNLQVGVFPAIQVEGKTPQEGQRGKLKKAKDWVPPIQNSKTEVATRPDEDYYVPDWNYLIYVILAVAPEGKLKLNQIFQLCVTWCPQISPKNESCRHCLTTKNFVTIDDEGDNVQKDENVKKKKKKVEAGGYWRIKNAGEVDKKGEVGKQEIEEGGEKEKRGGGGKGSASPKSPKKNKGAKTTGQLYDFAKGNPRLQRQASQEEGSGQLYDFAKGNPRLQRQASQEESSGRLYDFTKGNPRLQRQTSQETSSTSKKHNADEEVYEQEVAAEAPLELWPKIHEENTNQDPYDSDATIDDSNQADVSGPEVFVVVSPRIRAKSPARSLPPGTAWGTLKNYSRKEVPEYVKPFLYFINEAWKEPRPAPEPKGIFPSNLEVDSRTGKVHPKKRERKASQRLGEEEDEEDEEQAPPPKRQRVTKNSLAASLNS